MEELDENSYMIKKELRDITLSRSVVLQERENIKKKSQELDVLRVNLLKSPKKPVEKNPRNLYIYLDNVLTESARKIRLVLQGKGGTTETENVVKEQMESQFFDSENLNEVNPKIKALRDTLAYLKEKYDNEAVFFEKEKVSEIPKLLQNFKGLEIKALKSSISSISTLSPIRKISPARESSLSSLSKLRTLTDKIINPKHKRTPSSSSRGSVDVSEVENRKTEHKRYLKSLQKL